MVGDARVIVVDAANVVGSRPDGWWRDRVGAARRLLVRVVGLQERLVGGTEVVVVLEGAARGAVAGAEAVECGRVRVVLAPGSGDDTITAVTAELVDDPSAGAGVDGERSDHAVVVVTADRGLRERVEAVGAVTVGPRWLLEQLDDSGGRE